MKRNPLIESQILPDDLNLLVLILHRFIYFILYYHIIFEIIKNIYSVWENSQNIIFVWRSLRQKSLRVGSLNHWNLSICCCGFHEIELKIAHFWPINIFLDLRFFLSLMFHPILIKKGFDSASRLSLENLGKNLINIKVNKTLCVTIGTERA